MSALFGWQQKGRDRDGHAPLNINYVPTAS